MFFGDEQITERTSNEYSRLYTQEGAVIEISCKTRDANAESIYGVGTTWYGTWLLDYEDSGTTATRIDSDLGLFEITENFEKYHSTTVQETESFGHYMKRVTTLRYTGRLEDNGKYLQCRVGRSSVLVDGIHLALVILVVRRKFHHR